HVLVVQPPVAVRGPLVEIRRVAVGLSVHDLLERDSLSTEMLSVLRGAVASRKNIIVTGPVGCGVTTTLGALVGLCPSEERVVVVEAVPDLAVDREHVVSLATGGATSNVNIRQLVEQGSRLRSDRFVVDDVRGGEAFDVLGAIAARPGGSVV